MLTSFTATNVNIFPYGNVGFGGQLEVHARGDWGIIRDTRKRMGVTQKDLALTSGTGLRFVIDLEKGKQTCEIGKALRIIHTLGIRLNLTPPAAAKEE